MLMMIATSHIAFAAGTPANTSISNIVTLAYDVGGVAQPVITSNAAIFLVDTKVDLTVMEKDAHPTIVLPGQAATVASFTVTNQSNLVQDYALTGGNITSIPAVPVFGLADTFDATACNTFVETNGIAGYQAGADIATFIDELAPDASQDVYVVCNIPTGLVSDNQAVIELAAVAHVGGAAGLGAAMAQSVGANTAGNDIVFADAATPANADGTLPLQIAGDATAFAHDAFRVAAAVANVIKSATCSPAPANCSEAKTGTVIAYKILVNVTGTGTATALVITDPLPANVSYVPNSITVDGGARTDAADADNSQFSANTVTVSLGNIASPATITILFKATID